jgi:hypothetical protein
MAGVAVVSDMVEISRRAGPRRKDQNVKSSMADPGAAETKSCCKYVVLAQTKIAQTIVLVDIAQRIDVQLCDASKMLDAQPKSRKNDFMLRRTIAEFHLVVPKFFVCNTASLV